MNINQNIYKLLYALKMKGQLYKINSFKSYSKDNDKYRTAYQVLKRQFEQRYNPKTREYGKIEKYKKDYECYSKVELMKYLAKEYSKGSEAIGK